MKNEISTENISRKKFLVKFSAGMAAISAALVSIPVVRALLAPLIKKNAEQWRSVGTTDDFPIGSTRLVTFVNADPMPYAGTTANSAAWLRRNDRDSYTAFAANCTHLGCPVRWEAEAQLFMCPCHGGVYYDDGSVAVGPPPQPLTRYAVRIYKNKVQIQTAPLPITSLTKTK